MNTYLENLFDKYNISEGNRYEILQIYSLLPDNKKQNLINNFEILAVRLTKIEEEIQTEREILIDSAVVKMRDKLQKKKEEMLSDSSINDELDSLKKKI